MRRESVRFSVATTCRISLERSWSKQKELLPNLSHSIRPKQKSSRAEETYYTKVVAAAHNSIGLLRAEQQDFREASAQFALAAKWNPNQEGLNYNLGLANYKAESYKEAIPALEKELNINPTNIAIKQLLGLSYFMTADYAKARRC